MMRRTVWIALVVLGVMGAGAPVELHYFWAATCPDCAVMKDYLASLAAEFPELRIVDHEVGFSGENFRLLAAVAEAYGLEQYATPVVAVGDLATTGVGSVVELLLYEEVTRCTLEGCPSPLARIEDSLPAPAPVTWAWILVVLGGAALLFLLILR